MVCVKCLFVGGLITATLAGVIVSLHHGTPPCATLWAGSSLMFFYGWTGLAFFSFSDAFAHMKLHELVLAFCRAINICRASDPNGSPFIEVAGAHYARRAFSTPSLFGCCRRVLGGAIGAISRLKHFTYRAERKVPYAEPIWSLRGKIGLKFMLALRTTCFGFPHEPLGRLGVRAKILATYNTWLSFPCGVDLRTPTRTASLLIPRYFTADGACWAVFAEFMFTSPAKKLLLACNTMPVSAVFSVHQIYRIAYGNC